jgi:hypothetical protein
VSFDLSDYKDVPQRIADFKAKHPEGSLQPADPTNPFQVVVIAGSNFIAYAAAAYRSPDDPRPGIGVAYEPFPGKTPYTRDSELQNAETSAWGRAIVAALASESKSVASADEIRNRRADEDPAQHVKTSSRRECVICGGDLAGSKAKPAPGGFAHDPPCEPKDGP